MGQIAIKVNFRKKKSVPFVASRMHNLVPIDEEGWVESYVSPKFQNFIKSAVFAVFLPAQATVYIDHGKFWQVRVYRGFTLSHQMQS